MKKFIGKLCATVVATTLCATVIPSVAVMADTAETDDVMLISAQEEVIVAELTKDNFKVDAATLYQIDGTEETAVADLSEYITSNEFGDDWMRVEAVYGKNVYMTHWCAETWAFKTYVYNVETKEVTLVSDDLEIMDASGEYAVCTDVYVTDVSSFGHYLYKLTEDGMEEVCTLADDALGFKFIGNAIYFAAYPFEKGSDDFKYADMSKVVIKKLNLNDCSVKKVKTVKSKDKDGYAIVTKFGKKSCKVRVNGKVKTVKY